MALAAYLNPGVDLATASDLARACERLGYDSVWVTHGLGRDSFLVLAAYGAVTTRIGLGNGVVPIYPRHPVAMAQAALTLNEMTAGRFRLGIGVSHTASMEDMLGLRVVEPLAAMREYVAVLRGALGEGSDFSGRHYRARWAMAVPRRPPLTTGPHPATVRAVHRRPRPLHPRRPRPATNRALRLLALLHRDDSPPGLLQPPPPS